MSRFWPSTGEAESLRFVLASPARLRDRVLVAGGCFVLGVALWCLLPWSIPGFAGLVLVLAGHLPLWVRTQTNAPGGATPEHEEVWAPTDEDWFERVGELEDASARWDASPWDITSLRGFVIFLVIGATVAALVMGMGATFGFEALVVLAAAAGVLLVPLWLNGIRTTWNPSELRLKGEALSIAREVAGEPAGGELDAVPLLALRESARGKYPVDARLMLRPAEEDDSGFIGIQVQVALNNVQGRDYPYLYCVVLGKPGFRLPAARRRHKRPGFETQVVFERGDGEDVSYLVVRQHADKAGGWHTESWDIREIVGIALEVGRAAWRENRGGTP